MHARATMPRRGWHMIGELEVAGIVADHARLRHLCDRLERIADALPEAPDPALVRRCREDIEELLPLHQEREQRLLRGLFGAAASGTLVDVLTEHVRGRHLADLVHAEDIVVALGSGEHDGDAVAAEKLGYMLRCFFDGCRRAMAFEELSLIALAGNRLCHGAKESLLASLAANARSTQG